MEISPTAFCAAELLRVPTTNRPRGFASEHEESNPETWARAGVRAVETQRHHRIFRTAVHRVQDAQRVESYTHAMRAHAAAHMMAVPQLLLIYQPIVVAAWKRENIATLRPNAPTVRSYKTTDSFSPSGCILPRLTSIRNLV